MISVSLFTFLVMNMIALSICNPFERVGQEIVERQTWGARATIGNVTDLESPVPYVVVHHSSIPAACYELAECCKAMRSMQYVHQDTNGWADIGYNFGVGSDGVVYEGRGWTTVGAHAPLYNVKSIGVVLIGHWVSELPPVKQLVATKELIAWGVRLGYIRKDYILLGHRQVRDTECPGDVLYKEISTWKNFAVSIHYNPSIDIVLDSDRGEI